MYKRPDKWEVASFTFVFYALAAVVVVFLLCVLPSVVAFVVSP